MRDMRMLCSMGIGHLLVLLAIAALVKYVLFR